MDGGDPDMPTSKKPRLGSINHPVYNGLPPPLPTAQPSRHPSHLAPAQASSPPPNRHHYPPHSLPPPSQPFSPGPGHYVPPPPHPPPTSLPPSDLRSLSDPTKFVHRTHGNSVSHSPRVFPPDSISTYRQPPTPQHTSASEAEGSGSRTASTSEDKDTKPSMAHGGPSTSWHVNQDARNGGGVPNGYPTTMSPPIHNEPPFHTPALPPGQHYAQPPAGSYSPAPYMSQYPQGPGQMRRKQVRATQACNHCRSRKQKCDEARPCQFCRENNFDCQYKDVPVPKQDRSMMQLQDSVNSIADTLKTFVDNFNIWKQSVESRLPPTRPTDFMSTAMDQPSPEASFSARGSISEQHASRMPTPMQPRSQLTRINSMKQESPIISHSHASPFTAHSMTPIKQEVMTTNLQPPATPAESVDHSRCSKDGATGQDPGALETDHTTPAHKILPQWAAAYNLEQTVPALRRLVDMGKSITEYPLYYEQERGLLRVWGVGEGQDWNDGVQGVASPGSYAESDAPSPASINGREGLWGQPPTGHSSPSTMNGDLPRYREPSSLGSDGKPDFRMSTLRGLLDSYMTHVHILHPLLPPSQLEKMIEDFGKLYSPDARVSHSVSPAAIPDRLNPSLKRKRSSSMFGDSNGLADDQSKAGVERSLRNAIVLLVSALGKVCEHKTDLPAPKADRNPFSTGTPEYSRNSPRMSQGSVRSDDTEGSSKNIEILPGMVYFSHATDILGNQAVGNTVAHAQAFVLAALYLAQFGRVLDSWGWITNACRAALVLIKADLPRINRDRINRDASDGAVQEPVEPRLPKHEQHRLNLVKIVYWTCLSLETDILAEMSTLPATQVSKYQSDIMYPAGVYEHAPESPVVPDSGTNLQLYIYSSLIHLRVLLNGAHNYLYGSRSIPGQDVFKSAKSQADLVEKWLGCTPAILAWTDIDPPSVNLNVARLRAKVHGALYMIWRPCLWAAIQKFDQPRGTVASPFSNPSPATSSTGPGTPRDVMDPNSRHHALLLASHECIQAAIQSTVAFDRVGAEEDSPWNNFVSTRKVRLILTNIVGTLHAQFGNMIVLAAVYKSPLMTHLPQPSQLNFETLSRLFHRTMNILMEMAPNSPILQIDYDILAEIKKQLNLRSYS
ncbi:hypothetical protein CC80DRAFT_8306 [Byssothecium circinans]|uniref:Zn(2)-C6 fungal-type domain-containing protein n=1 Tax=Byssothecium circinans TaxID=147558 RepID=A0A6A5UHU7_9PLEO|nr:hypothetical protein CC80DRAFT_8306 [Byssothecium circinans]